MHTAIAIVISCPPSWVPPANLDIADPGHTGTDEQVCAYNAKTYAKRAAALIGIDQSDTSNLVVEYRADPLLRDALCIEYMTSSSFLARAGIKESVEILAMSIGRQMSLYIGPKQIPTVTVSITMFDGERCSIELTRT